MAIDHKNIKRKTYWKQKCDELFSEIIRLRAKEKCEETNDSYRPNCAHIVSRGYLATRWDLDNAICLAWNRHRYYTDRPLEWEKFIISKIGKVKWQQLKDRALYYKTWTLEELKELYEKLSNLRNSWNRPKRKFDLFVYQGFPTYHFRAGNEARAIYGYSWKD